MKNGKTRLVDAYLASEQTKDEILNELKSEIQQSTIVSINDAEKDKKKTKRANDPISKVLRTNSRAFKFQSSMNSLLLRILDRYEVDKPILMADKLDIIWDKNSKARPEKDIDNE